MKRKSAYFFFLFCFFTSFYSSAQVKKSCAVWLSTSPATSGIASIQDATFLLNDQYSTFQDVSKLPMDTIGKIEVYARKQAIAKFGKEKGRNGVIVVEIEKIPKRGNIISINDSVKYFVEAGDTVFTGTERIGEFVGGNASWIKYLQKNLRADITVENGAPPGLYKDVIAFTINADGTLADAKIIYDAGYGTGKESLRIIQQSNSLWQPSKHEGEPVKSILLQTFTFEVAES